MAPVKTKSDTPMLKIFKIHPEVQLPKFATEQSACFDIAANMVGKLEYVGWNANNTKFVRPISAGIIKIMPGDRVMVPTGLIFDIPEGYSVRIHSRSGLSLKNGLILSNCEGVIDSDYIEEIYILLTNTSVNPQTVYVGDRIAQAELVSVLSYEITETKKVPTLKTSRNGGLGSTGINETDEVPVDVPV